MSARSNRAVETPHSTNASVSAGAVPPLATVPKLTKLRSKLAAVSAELNPEPAFAPGFAQKAQHQEPSRVAPMKRAIERIVPIALEMLCSGATATTRRSGGTRTTPRKSAHPLPLAAGCALPRAVLRRSLGRTLRAQCFRRFQRSQHETSDTKRRGHARPAVGRARNRLVRGSRSEVAVDQVLQVLLTPALRTRLEARVEHVLR